MTLVLDPAKVKLVDHASYVVKYCLFWTKTPANLITDTKKYENVIRNSNRACFAEVRSLVERFLLENKVAPNRLFFECDRTQHTKKEVHLTDAEIERWIELCKDNKLLPKYITGRAAKKGTFCFDLSRTSGRLLYIYLNAARHIQEEPHFIRAMIHLIDDHKMKFFTAVGLATTLCINNSGHHFIYQSKNYGVTLNKLPSVINYTLTAGLYNFLNTTDEDTHISAKEISEISFEERRKLIGIRLFDLSDKIRTICKNNTLSIKLDELCDPKTELKIKKFFGK